MPLSAQQQQDLHALRQIAEKLSTACPDMLQMARETAGAILGRHHLDDLEPDQVYFHRFHEAISSPRTFTGWQHVTQPFQTMTLVQLVMRRFTTAEQDASDLLSTYSGFYSKGAGEVAYDERNEIRLLPKSALDDFWNIDFSHCFDQRASAFWSRHGDDYRTLAKATFLAKALETQAQTSDNALASRVQQAAKALAGEHGGPVTLQYLRQANLPSHGVSVHAFSIGERVASDILRIVMPDGYQLLYTPGETQAFHLFASDREIHAWVLANTLEPAQKARLMSHFPLTAHEASSLHKTVGFFAHFASIDLSGLFDVMWRQWDAAEPGGINKPDTPLQMDAFSHLRLATQQRMADDANFALRSNSDLRKQLWLGYLRAANTVFGPLTALAWPIALAGVGAGIAEIGLDIDQAINGHTSAERLAGVESAIFAVINTLMIGFAGASDARGVASPADAFVPPLEDPVESVIPDENPIEPVAPEALEPVTPEEIEAWLPKEFQPSELDNQLQALQTNEVVTGATGSGELEGIYSKDGNFYAMLGDLAYQVRYVRELNTWVIVDPQQPFAFRQSIPIARDADGNWQVGGSLGLKGGSNQITRKFLSAWRRLNPRPVLPPLTVELYEIPEPQYSELKDFALMGQDADPYHTLRDPYLGSRGRAYHAALNRIDSDAVAFYEHFEQPPRPAIPHFENASDARQFLGSLYQNSEGLVFGEAHREIYARRFLIENMRRLKQLGVKVLYSEHFMIDYQQAALDEFNRTGKLPAELKTYINTWDDNATITATPYGLKQVLYEAFVQNIRVQGIDTMVSYRGIWKSETNLSQPRQNMMNYAAHKIITADQAQRGPSRWVALMGNTHANTFYEVPGVSELEGCLGVRVEGAGIGEALSIGIDPGHAVDGIFVQSDLVLSVPPAIS
ncbi:membrane-targeted effector domain-containing toxin [Pseudomonas putida]|uniref:Dermonecrotic toxin N-terminal domain-containing protein n=1 Tax=Pseudomonas putida TaxID=303 RepID=A0A6I6Y567_PSEPU|nr:membrane-targeted effector domain-containing toxin [Pseudomonas putida]QHG66734.2 hypothetical protein C2H86_20965 [Pseudomonas putida]